MHEVLAPSQEIPWRTAQAAVAAPRLTAAFCRRLQLRAGPHSPARAPCHVQPHLAQGHGCRPQRSQQRVQPQPSDCLLSQGSEQPLHLLQHPVQTQATTPTACGSLWAWATRGRDMMEPDSNVSTPADVSTAPLFDCSHSLADL